MVRFGLAAVAAVIVISACSTGGGTPTAQPPVATPTAVATASTPASTALASPTATAAAPTPTLAATPSTAVATPTAGEPQQTPHGALDLEALIPDQVGDITLDDPMSLSGQEYLDAATGGIPQNVEAFNDFLAGLGRTVDDLSGATTSGFSESGDDNLYVTANRVAGADGNLLLSQTVQFNLDSIPLFNSAMAGTATQVTLGGKPVTKIVTVYNESMVYDTSYYYGYGDTIFKVSASTEEIVAEALGLLP